MPQYYPARTRRRITQANLVLPWRRPCPIFPIYFIRVDIERRHLWDRLNSIRGMDWRQDSIAASTRMMRALDKRRGEKQGLPGREVAQHKLSQVLRRG